MVRLRRRIDHLCAGRDDVLVDHGFDVSGASGVPAQPGGGAVHGWRTTLSPVAVGQPVRIWFDGFDGDLAAMIDDRHWFEWRDVDDEDAVIADVVGLCEGVLSGDLWEWRTRRSSGCDVVLPDGRVLTATRGRVLPVPWVNPARARRRLPGYGFVEPG